ncbi:MAG: nitroreductase family protein [Candidatus Aminicenantales bacterium]
MSAYDLILRRRTIRQFKPDPIPREVLEKIVNAGRLAPSAANKQPLEFLVVDEPRLCRLVFPHLSWAAYISPKGNPKPGQEPVAYIITLVNLAICDRGYEYDVGAAMENMILAGWDAGVGSCWLISVNREKIAELFALPDGYRVDCVLALGYPAESPVVEEFAGSVRYWLDEEGRLHVPKRSLSSVIHFNSFTSRQR